MDSSTSRLDRPILNKINISLGSISKTDRDRRIKELCLLWSKDKKERNEHLSAAARASYFVDIIIPLKQLIDEGSILLKDLASLNPSDLTYKILAELSYFSLKDKTFAEKIEILDESFGKLF